jgi:hypothetical protein
VGKVPKRVLGAWRSHPFARITKPNTDKQYSFFANIVPTIYLSANFPCQKTYNSENYILVWFIRRSVFGRPPVRGIAYSTKASVTPLPSTLQGYSWRNSTEQPVAESLSPSRTGFIPVKFVGLGEKPEDIAEFNPDVFIEALFG